MEQFYIFTSCLTNFYNIQNTVKNFQELNPEIDAWYEYGGNGCYRIIVLNNAWMMQELLTQTGLMLFDFEEAYTYFSEKPYFKGAKWFNFHFIPQG